MHQMTRLEAVNEILRVKTGERIATEDELDTVPQAVEANTQLNNAVVRAMVDHKWFFNDIENGALTSDSSGEVVLPDDLSYIKFESTDAASQVRHLRPVYGKVYDIYKHTYNLGAAGKTVRYSGKMVWAYEALPTAFQLLAIAQARKDIVSGSTHISATRSAEEKLRYNEAFTTAQKFDDELSGGRLRNPNPYHRQRAPRNRGWV